MTGPGLALFYGGLVRKKNILATMMQSFALMAIITVVWGYVGYSLCFAPGNQFIGGFGYVFLRGVGATPNADYAATIPQQTFMIFQLMFAIITPGLIAGAFAERMKFSAMVVFTTLWFFIRLRPDGAHGLGRREACSTRRCGGISHAGFCRRHSGAHHLRSFRASLRALSRKTRRLSEGTHAAAQRSPQLHRRVPAVGRLVRLQRGQRAQRQRPRHQRIRRHTFRRRRRSIGWAAAEWIRNGKPSVLGAISGAVAGLVAITPASGFVGPMSALVIGLCAGVGCYLMVTKVKSLFGYDDSLDAFGVHGAGGTLGALLTGIFATKLVNPVFKDAQGNALNVGLFDGNAHQILNQSSAL